MSDTEVARTDETASYLEILTPVSQRTCRVLGTIAISIMIGAVWITWNEPWRWGNTLNRGELLVFGLFMGFAVLFLVLYSLSSRRAIAWHRKQVEKSPKLGEVVLDLGHPLDLYRKSYHPRSLMRSVPPCGLAFISLVLYIFAGSDATMANMAVLIGLVLVSAPDSHAMERWARDKAEADFAR